MKLSRAISIASRWMQGHVVTLRDGEAREYHKLCHEALKRMREQESAKNAHYNCCKKATSSWISVEEKLPEEAIRVLVRLGGEKPLIGEPRMDTDRVVDGRWVRWFDLVTHWMPLPEPPEEG